MVLGLGHGAPVRPGATAEPRSVTWPDSRRPLPRPPQGWPRLQEAAFEYDRQVQLAVAVLVEQHRDLVGVVTLHRALAPALAHDARAHRERDVGARRLGVREVVVAVSARAGV